MPIMIVFLFHRVPEAINYSYFWLLTSKWIVLVGFGCIFYNCSNWQMRGSATHFTKKKTGAIFKWVSKEIQYILELNHLHCSIFKFLFSFLSSQ